MIWFGILKVISNLTLLRQNYTYFCNSIKVAPRPPGVGNKYCRAVLRDFGSTKDHGICVLLHEKKMQRYFILKSAECPPQL